MSEGKKPFIKDYHLCLTCDRQIGSLLKLSSFCIIENLCDREGVKTQPDKKRKSVAVPTTCLQIEQPLGYKTNGLGRSRWFCHVPFPSPNGIGAVMPAAPTPKAEKKASGSCGYDGKAEMNAVYKIRDNQFSSLWIRTEKLGALKYRNDGLSS